MLPKHNADKILHQHQDYGYYKDNQHEDGQVPIAQRYPVDKFQRGSFIPTIAGRQNEDRDDSDAGHAGQNYGKGQGCSEQNRGQQGVNEGRNIGPHNIWDYVLAADEAAGTERH